MMKRILALLLVGGILLGLLGCGEEKTAPEETQPAQTGSFTVGYGRANVTPRVPVGLTGFGNATTRISDNLLSYLYLTCLAVTDAGDHTALLISLDATTSDRDVTQALRSAVTKATGVPGENIMVSATHTHSAPAITDPIFQNLLLSGAVEAAQAALADRREATVKIGTAQTQGLNFVRHYVLEDGSYRGDNYGTLNKSPIVDHVSEADGQMQLLHFVRQDRDIVVMNFQGHATLTGGASKYDISADFIGACREQMEKELDCDFMYFSGAGGNLNVTSKIPEENMPEIDYRIHGKALAQYAIDAMPALTEVTADRVQVLSQNFQAKCSHDEDGDLMQYVGIVEDAFRSGGAANAQRVGDPYGIHSVYHARAINRRAGGTYGEYLDVPLSTVAIGDVAFVAAPYEMFDVNGVQIKEGSPYEMTFIMTCANHHFSYIAPEYAFDHGCYEVDMRYFVRGTAEQLVECYLNMLTQMKEG